jgi:hypothetical protein
VLNDTPICTTFPAESNAAVLGFQVRDIPTIGGDGFISHWLTARKFSEEAHRMIAEGYRKVGRSPSLPTEVTKGRSVLVSWASFQDSNV